MTSEKYEEVRLLKNQIDNVIYTIAKIDIREYSLDPPSRDSGFEIGRRVSSMVSLSEGEMVCIINALKEYRVKLEQDFEKL